MVSCRWASDRVDGNTLWAAWWLDPVVALGIAGWAVTEGRRAWAGKSCRCACQ